MADQLNQSFRTFSQKIFAAISQLSERDSASEEILKFTLESAMPKMITIVKKNQIDKCHARMNETMSYLHIPKTTCMGYMYETNYCD